MNTQTNQNANQGENNDTKKGIAAKVATGVAATAAAASIGGVVASVVGNNNENEPLAEQDAQTPLEGTSQAEQEFNQMMTSNETGNNVSQAQPGPQATSAAAVNQAPSAQPHVAQSHTAQSHTAQPHATGHHATQQHTAHQQVAQQQAGQPNTAQPHAVHTEEAYNDIPVDESWLNTPSAQEPIASNNPIPAHEQQAVAAVTQANELGYDPNDVLINTVNVSPEVLMAMLHLKPTHMIQTEYRGDGLGHTAALLASEDGENYMLIDTNGDGLLDKLTDMDGNSYASLDENTQFVVDANAMTNFIDTTNPADNNYEPMYAHIDEAEIVNIEGEGEGEEMAFIDDNDISDDNTADNPEEEMIEDEAADDLALENELEQDLASADETDINTDLLSYDDSSLA